MLEFDPLAEGAYVVTTDGRDKDLMILGCDATILHGGGYRQMPSVLLMVVKLIQLREPSRLRLHGTAGLKADGAMR